jgi:peptidoglycan hydrolase-like protein with peptidoglycan-binding domain
VSLGRILRVGSKGRDVRAVQRALKKAGSRPATHPLSNLFDDQMVEEVKAFQTAQGIGVDGEVGEETFARLEPFVDAFGKSLIGAAQRQLASASNVRQQIVAAAECGYRNRDSIHYTQDARRMSGIRDQRRPSAFGEWEDCSSFATWCYWAAGAPDPNGLSYNGQGYTGTQVQNGRITANPQPGDLVFYGAGAVPRHVAVYVGNGRVVSHGSEPGPTLVPIDYRSDRTQVRSYVP